MREVSEYFRGWRFALVFIIASMQFVSRFLFSTLLGALVLVAVSYWAVEMFTSIDPLNAAQLLGWFDELSADTKATVMASLLTVLGFLIAFQTSHAAWRSELYGSLSAEAARSIHDHYVETTRLLNDVSIYLRGVADTTDAIRAGDLGPATIGSAIHWNGQNEKATERAHRLAHLIVTAHHLPGRFSPITLNTPGVPDSIEHANEKIGSVMEAIWWILPRLDPAAPQFLQQFSAYARSPAELRTKAADISAVNDSVSGTAGKVRGTLMNAIVKPNVAALWWIVRHRKDIISEPKSETAEPP